MPVESSARDLHKQAQRFTALSEAVVALACVGAGALVIGSGATTPKQVAVGGFALVMIAAMVGVARFAGLGNVRAVHEVLSAQARAVGLVLLALAAWCGPAAEAGQAHLLLGTSALAVASFWVVFLAFPRQRGAVEMGMVIVGSSLLLVHTVCGVRCYLGMALTVWAVAILVDRSGRTVVGLRAVDVYHYLIAAALLLVAYDFTTI